ncbi:Diacylglycerol O-acyltransferase 1 [Nakaseomyces bracarensis]|uniref:Diacylglycerol O-acyltransferase n=1 Tax=Nakaseomyces bracarensis TaxID=273131 RepID=A0ABR4NVH5_9SACH
MGIIDNVLRFRTIRRKSSDRLDQDESSDDGSPNIVEEKTKDIKVVKPLKKPRLSNCCSLSTPMENRLQTLAVAWHISSFVLFSIISLFIFSNPFTWIVVIPYLIYFFTDRTAGNGGVVYRYSPWVRSLRIWKYYAEYFPVRLTKTVDLEPTFTPCSEDQEDKKIQEYYKLRLWPTQIRINTFKKNAIYSHGYKRTGPKYIFGYHPHGIGALGSFGAFGTEGCDFSKKFPGIPISLLTLVNQFHIPFYRDYLLSVGISSVSRKNALKVLGNDQSICIVVGGARESLISIPGTSGLILNKRKGFIKLALQAGNVSLVPVYTFGENDCYNILSTNETSIIRRIQLWVKENFGFTIPIFYARGLFNYDFGLLPFRAPLNVVVGKPIHVKEQQDEPDPKLVDYYHELYIEELKKVYMDHRDDYGYGGVDFEIVG